MCLILPIIHQGVWEHVTLKAKGSRDIGVFDALITVYKNCCRDFLHTCTFSKVSALPPRLWQIWLINRELPVRMVLFVSRASALNEGDALDFLAVAEVPDAAGFVA